MRKDLRRGFLSIVAGLVAWEVLARLFLENDLLVPAPSAVARAFWKLGASGQLNEHFAATLMEFAYGFAAAAAVGIPIGYLMGMHKWFDEWMDPWIAALYSIPIITVVPLIIIWFGIGMLSKVVVVFKITVVELILNTAAGIKTIDPVWLEVSRSLRLTRWQTTYKIRFPAALPFIVTGMRLGVGARPFGRHRRRAARLQRRPRLPAPRGLRDLGQPQAVRDRGVSRRDGHGELPADQKGRAEARALAPHGGMVSKSLSV